MNDERMELPEALAREIGRDLAPVRPLLRFELRFACIALIALFCGALFLSLHGLRGDFPRLPPIAVLTVFFVRVGAGATLLLLAMREAVPSAGWTDRSRRVALIAATSALLVLPEVFARAIDLRGPSRVAPFTCFPLALLVSVPSFLLALLLLRRAWPLRPVMTAVLAGLGSGMFGGAAIFIACDNASTAHALAVHESAVLALALLGGVAGWFIGVRRTRRTL